MMLNSYALKDKAGKTRLTCLAISIPHAGRKFIRMRGGRAMPDGWVIVWRGHVEAGPTPTIAPSGVEALMAEARQLIHDQGETIARLTAERNALLADAAGHAAAMSTLRERLEDARRQVKQLEARLEAARAIARVIELAKASTVEEWDHGTLLRDVLERGVE